MAKTSSKAAKQEALRTENRPCQPRFRSFRQTSKKCIGLVGLVALSILLAGCPDKVEDAVRSLPNAAHVQCDLWPYGSVTDCHFGLGLSAPPASPPGTLFQGAIASPGPMLRSAINWGTLSADDIYIDTAGTTASLPTNGTGTLSVFDESGQLIGASTFDWVRYGTKIKLQNPSAVQTWLQGYASTGARIEYELAPIAVPMNGQYVTLKNRLVIDHQTTAMASYSFVAHKPGHRSPQRPHL